MRSVRRSVQVKGTRTALLWAAALIAVLLVCCRAAGSYVEGENILVWRERLLHDLLTQPLSVQVTAATGPVCLLGFSLWAALLGGSLQQSGKWRRREEHGSADWGNARRLKKKWEDPAAQLFLPGEEKTADRRLKLPRMMRAGYCLEDPNIILSKRLRLGLGNGRLHHKNRNILVIGGSGTGKSRGLVMPNLLQLNSSFVVTDPSGELYDTLGDFLRRAGYRVRCLNLDRMAQSRKMNPFAYIRREEDVGRLATSFIRNTEDTKKTGGDAFWTDCLRLLLTALIAYLWEFLPPQERTFGILTGLVRLGRLADDNMQARSDLDRLFEMAVMEDPDALACRTYLLYLAAAPKTRASVLITLSSRLSIFSMDAVCELTAKDELHLEKLGQEKTALFCILPQAETTFNFLAGLLYTTLFTELYRAGDARARAEGTHALPVPVQVYLDEFANIALPENFGQILATCRKYGVSVAIFLQNLTQLKEKYERGWESVAGNCDSLIYLGGNEGFTWKYISDALGKETINVQHASKNERGQGTSRQVMGRELMTTGEVRGLPDNKCIVLVRGEDGILDDKYDLLSHPNWKHVRRPQMRTLQKPKEEAYEKYLQELEEEQKPRVDAK